MKALKMSEPDNIYFFSNPVMQKFAELMESVKGAATIEQATYDSISQAFNELDEETKATHTAEFSELANKIAKEAPDVEATLFNETGMKLSEIKDMQRKFNEMAAAAKFSETEKKVESFTFSDTNTQGIILPKASPSVAQFASKLSDTLQAEFFELFSNKSFRTVDLKEVGGNDGEAKFSIPTETPNGVTRESFVLDYVAKKFSEEKKIDYGTAMFEAAKYIKDNNLE